MRCFIIVFLTLFLVCGHAAQAPTTFSWKGDKPAGSAAVKERTSIGGKKFLHAFLTVKLRKETPGFRFAPMIAFRDSSGKFIPGTRSFSEGLPQIHNGDFIDYEEYFQIPAKAAEAEIQFFFYGNPGLIELVSYTLTGVDKQPKSESMRYPRWTNPDRLSDEELDKKLEQLPVCTASVMQKADYNVIAVNGKEFFSPIYLTTGYACPLRYSMVKRYSQAGIKLFAVPLTLGVARPGRGVSDIWTGEETYDFSRVRKALRELLRESPDVKILLSLNVSQYRGFATKHPEEIFQDSNGTFGSFYHGYVRKTVKTPQELPKGKDGYYSPASYCSEVFRNGAAKAIRNLCRYIASLPEGKSVIAVYLNGGGDGQWFDQFNSHGVSIAADYSPAAVKGFREFLKTKYHGNVELLRKAWQEKDVTFETAAVPSRSQLWDMKNEFHTLNRSCSRPADYCEYIGWARAQMAIAWSKAVKEGSGNRWLAGGYYRNSGLRGYPQIGHESIRYIMEAPEVDLLAVVPAYLRNFREPVHQGCYDGTLRRSGKILITELDLRNGELPNWGRWGTDFWRSHNTAERFAIDTVRFAASSLEKGGMFHIYDMEGGWFNSDASLEAWKAASQLLKERESMPVTDDHIAYIAGERFWNYQSFGKGRISVYTTCEDPLYALYRSGVKNSVYLLDDVLKKDFKAPKVMLFAEAGTLTLEQAQDIRKRFGNSGRVIVWFHTPGMFTDNGGKNLNAITGFQLVRAPQADNKPAFANGDSRDPLMKDVKGFLIPCVQDYWKDWGKAWTVKDSSAKILAGYFGTNIPAMAVKRYADHTEVWCGAPGSLTPQLCRNFARESGFAPFLESDDYSGFRSGLLYVSALSAGRKNILLPDGYSFDKVITGQKAAVSGKQVTVELKTGELLILKLRRGKVIGQ